jgi:hypothetical protein
MYIQVFAIIYYAFRVYRTSKTEITVPHSSAEVRPSGGVGGGCGTAAEPRICGTSAPVASPIRGPNRLSIRLTLPLFFCHCEPSIGVECQSASSAILIFSCSSRFSQYMCLVESLPKQQQRTACAMLALLLLCLAAWLGHHSCLAAALPPTTVNVSTSQQLLAALSSRTGDTTIVLQGDLALGPEFERLEGNPLKITK